MNGDDWDDELDDWDDEEDEEKEMSMRAYQGFGPICLSMQCQHWGGDSLCDLAIQIMVADDRGTEMPNDFCPLSSD